MNRLIDHPIHTLKLVLKYVLSLRWIRHIWMYTIRILERMEDDHIFLSAGGIAFSTILCLIPTVLLIFYVLGIYLSSEQAVQTINQYIDTLRLFPIEREHLRIEIFNTISEFIENKSIAGVIGGIGLVWTASALFSSIRSVFNKIFHVANTKNVVLSKIKDFVMLSLIGLFFIITTIFTYALSAVQNLGHEFLGGIFEETIFVGTLSYITSVVVTFITFCLLFFFVPDKRLPFKSIFISSLLSTVMWELAKQTFGYYISNFWSIGRVYGPYSFLIASSVWIYYSSLTIIIAAEFGEMFIERKYMRELFKPRKMREISKILERVEFTSKVDSR